MFSRQHNHQVFRIVIASISIDVMDDFSVTQFSPYGLLGHKPVY